MAQEPSAAHAQAVEQMLYRLRYVLMGVDHFSMGLSGSLDVVELRVPGLSAKDLWLRICAAPSSPPTQRAEEA